MDNCYSSSKQLLKLLKAKHTNGYLKDSVLSHPDHPSFLSIANTLSKYSIKNAVVKLSINKFDELSTPCIVQVSIIGTALLYTLHKIKKLSLKNLKLEANEMLQRSQLKSVFGGYSAEGSCAIKCASGAWIHNCPDVSPSTQEWAFWQLAVYRIILENIPQ